MGSPICLMVFFLLAAESVHGQDRFFISAPNVFHVGVKERVYVQLGKALLNTRDTLYLEHETIVTQKNSTVCTEEVPIQTVELEAERDKLPTFVDIPYLMLVAEMEGNKNRKMIQVGEGSAVLQTSKLVKQLQSNLNTTLSDMDQSEAKLYMAVSVTDIISGELLEAEVSLPVVSQRYTVDLSRTRSHYIPGVPLSVVVVVRLPNGSPAVGEPVKMHLQKLEDGAQTIKTNEEGAVWHNFNLPNLDRDITVEVTVDGQQKTKDVKLALSPGDTYLSVSMGQEILTAGQSLSVLFKDVNGSPEVGFIYFMCSERPYHKKKETFGPVKLEKKARFEHACYSPTVDYGFIVQVISMSVKSNFELYTTNLTQVLRATGDVKLEESTVRVFANRFQCKGQLETGTKYLIMGKDGATTDSNGQMQYLLESNTWIEQVPDGKKCKGSNNTPTCKKCNDFVSEYMLNGCTQ